MPYLSSNSVIIAAREATRGTKAALGASGAGKARRIGITDRPVELPDLKQEYFKYRTHGSQRRIQRQVAGRMSFGPASLPLIPLDGFIFWLCMSRESCTGTIPGTPVNTTASNAEAVGSTEIEVASATGLVAGDYVEIDGAGTTSFGLPISEVHKIASIAASTLTLETGLLYAHDAGVTVKKVIAPFIHRLDVATKARKDTGTIQALLNQDPDEDDKFLRSFLGSTVASWEMKADDPSGDGGDLRLAPTFTALDLDDDDAAVGAVTIPSFPDKDPFMFFHTGTTITAFGRNMGKVVSFTLRHDEKQSTRRYFGAGATPDAGRKPSAYINHAPEMEFRMTIVPDDILAGTNNLYSMMKNRTKSDITIPFIRDLSASVGWAESSDAIRITLKNCRIEQHPLSLGGEGEEITSDVVVFPEYFYIEVKDSDAMYSVS